MYSREIMLASQELPIQPSTATTQIVQVHSREKAVSTFQSESYTLQSKTQIQYLLMTLDLAHFFFLHSIKV